MPISAALRRKSVCGPGCAEIVAFGDRDIRHPLCVEAAWSLLPGSRPRPLSDTMPTVLALHGSRFGPVRLSVGYRSYATIVSSRSISLVLLAAPASVQDLGCCRAGRALRVTQRQSPELGHPTASSPANSPCSSATK